MNWRNVVLAGLWAGLMLLTVWLSAQQDATAGELPVPLTSYSAAPNGAKALALWLEELGYRVRRVEGVNFWVDRDAQMLLVLRPLQAFSPGEVKTVDNWVRRGGLLVYAVPGFLFEDALLASFDLDIGYFDDGVEKAEALLPVWLNPPVTRVSVQTDHYLVSEREDGVALLGAEGRTVALTFAHGKGRVVVTSVDFPFTNVGLRNADNAQWVYNLAALAEPGAVIVFDEFHHGYRTAHTLGTWFRTTRQGQSLLFAGGVVFVYLLAGGRRFGRPLPAPRAGLQRAPVEYIQAMANLFRRGHKRTAILHHYHETLKRRLAQAYRLDPGMDDAAFAAQVAAVRPGTDADELLRLLSETRQERMSESALIKLAQEVDRWTAEIN